MPVTVTAPTNGRPSASRNDIPAGRPGRGRRAMTDAETIGSGREEPTRGSEHLFEEGGDVVAAAVQHRADALHAHPLEAAAGAFDPRHTGAVGLDHPQSGVAARRLDRRVRAALGARRLDDSILGPLAGLI